MASALEQRMVKTRAVRVSFKPEQKVEHLCLSSDGACLVWAEQGGAVSIAISAENEDHRIAGVWNAPGGVVGMCLRGDRTFVLDDTDGLSCLNSKAESEWHLTIPGGGFSLHQGPNDMAVVDALGRLYRISYGGQLQNLNHFEHILKATFVDQYLVLAHEDGSVQALNEDQPIWQRPSRGEVGEAITAIGSDASGHLLLGREGYALVDGDEEALEMETWCLNRLELLDRCDLKSRVTHLVPGLESVICGFDNGRVTLYKHNAHRELLMTNYAIQTLLVRGGHVVASSWFYLFGHNEAGEGWKVEHQGMPTQLAASANGSILFFAGEDQNDWTDAEPIGCLSLDSETIEIDPSELNAWFQQEDSGPERSAEEIYRVDDSVENLLTDEERRMMAKPVEVGLEDLQDALDGFIENVSTDEATQGTLNLDSSELLEALDDQISSMAMLPDEDLFGALNEEVSAPIPPVPRAGEDRVVVCEEDGTAVVLLDGLGSSDEQNRIVMWSWVDSTGKEIATQAQAKVRLSVGVHRFELRICDSEGRWSSDSIQLTLKRA